MDPLDIPLCDSKADNGSPEAPVIQLGDVEYPPAIPYSELESVSDTQPSTRSESQTTEATSTEARKESESTVAVPATGQAPLNASENDSSATSEKTTSELDVPPVKAKSPDLLFRYHTLQEEKNTCIIEKYIGDPVDCLSVPSQINGITVIEIGRGAFAHCSIHEVSLPDSLVVIGDYAFTGCMGLNSVSGGGNVRKIGHGIFNGCLNLKHCNLLLNTSLQRPEDAFVERLLRQLAAVQNPNGGETA